MEFVLSRRTDITLILILLTMGFSASFVGSEKINSRAVNALDVWFQADIGRVYANMTDRHSNHYRSTVHPVFSLATNPAIYVLRTAGLQEKVAVRIFVAALTGLWLASIFLVLRLVGLCHLDSTLFTVLAGVSASAVFFCTVPETFLLGSLTMLVVMGFVIVSGERSFHVAWHTVVSAISLSMTVTNWMVGILATIVNNSFRRSVSITLAAFLLITGIYAVQNAIYPSSTFFLFSPEEKNYILIEAAGGFSEKTVAFFLHSMIMPAVQLLQDSPTADWPRLTIQFSSIGSTGLLGWAITFIWGGLLLFGVWATLQYPVQKKFRTVLGWTILGQLVLHLFYGDETFLYSLHWLPFLVLLAAMGATSSYRRYVLALVTVLIVGAGFNNYQQFDSVAAELNSAQFPAR